ncbi:uncharacterized protein LOC129168123 isoform X3 [Dunckerocampus dactyliophorus]|uniref:uncharacterized protein LOC129168123 isoform X3 n=1 Tax=Dunckerocampus dactyliophorus TaxID=161453 RepID=UPI0024054676|nr:uncharacterized protein LOC129168123 isoform X3 [Dunckerocampus dactyliophorus]
MVNRSLKPHTRSWCQGRSYVTRGPVPAHSLWTGMLEVAVGSVSIKAAHRWRGPLLRRRSPSTQANTSGAPTMNAKWDKLTLSNKVLIESKRGEDHFFPAAKVKDLSFSQALLKNAPPDESLRGSGARASGEGGGESALSGGEVASFANVWAVAGRAAGPVQGAARPDRRGGRGEIRLRIQSQQTQHRHPRTEAEGAGPGWQVQKTRLEKGKGVRRRNDEGPPGLQAQGLHGPPRQPQVCEEGGCQTGQGAHERGG